uniref:Uncharacterized protein n=1 Tax=Clytia hemisphaerica TaxID=252671 RepID=A0A7M5XGZ2_9CNID
SIKFFTPRSLKNKKFKDRMRKSNLPDYTPFTKNEGRKRAASNSAKFRMSMETPAMTSFATNSTISGNNRVLTSKHSGARSVPRSISTPGAGKNNMLLIAIAEGRGLAKGEIGLTSLDFKASEMVLSQFSDNATYVKVLTKIQVLQPNEIIMPTTACENGNMSPLFEAISQQNPHINLTTVQRKYFNETKGLECIKDVCVPEFQTVEMDVQNKYYCLATTAALVKYTEFVYNMVLAAKSLKVLFKGGEKTMLIDNTASSNLELVHNARDPRSLHSLYGVLNHTKTPGGGRLLRSNILQPPCDISTITQRYDCITELTEKEGLFRNLQTVLSRFLDVDQLISCLVQIPKKKDLRVFEKKIADSISLKHVIELIPTLQEALKDSENGLFKAYYQSLSDPRYENILEEIGTVIHDETHYHKGTLNMRTQKLFSVKPNVNGLLDVARRSHCEVIDDITEIVQQEAKDSGLPFTPNFNSTRGFHMQLTMSGRNITADQLPPKYVKVLQNRNVLSCTTEDLHV